MAQFLLKLLLKRKILAVYHDFHRLLLSAKLLTAILNSRYVKETVSEMWERSELVADIFLPTSQPWYQPFQPQRLCSTATRRDIRQLDVFADVNCPDVVLSVFYQSVAARLDGLQPSLKNV